MVCLCNKDIQLSSSRLDPRTIIPLLNMFAEFEAFLTENRLEAKTFLTWAMDVFKFAQARGENPNDLFQKFVEHSNNLNIVLGDTIKKSISQALNAEVLHGMVAGLTEAKAHEVVNQVETCIKTTQNPVLLQEVQRIAVGWSENTLSLGQVKQALSGLVESLKTIESRVEQVSSNLDNHVLVYTSENSSIKGRAAEERYQMLLNASFPEHEISDMSKTPQSMDLLLQKDDKPSIMVDIKFYNSKNVSQDGD
jgi:hypothetical protein